MSKMELATRQMEAWAADESHGYDQTNRWGQDYDCSSAVISAWEVAGVPVKSNGATYTGNMRGVFLRCGFADVTASVNLSTGAGLQRGDVLLNYRHHTAMYCGGGMEVEASINEFGGTTGGQPGDQTGREFYVRAYRNYPWDCVLRYIAEGAGTNPGEPTKPTYFYSVMLPLLKLGMEDEAVTALQALLVVRGFSPGGIDGVMDAQTVQAVKAYQLSAGLTADGECGGDTWAALLRRREQSSYTSLHRPL